MADYLPLFKPGEAIHYAASAAITGGQLVEVTGTGTVGPAAAGSIKVVGVAAFDAASGERVTIFCGGVQRVNAAAGGVTAGDVLQAGAAGTVAPVAASGAAYVQAEANNYRAVIGIALTTAAAGVAVECQMDR